MAAASRQQNAIEAVIVADQAVTLRMPWPRVAPSTGSPNSCHGREEGASAPAGNVLDAHTDVDKRLDTVRAPKMAYQVPQTMATPPAQLSPVPTDHYVSLPRRPRRSFLRRGGVMQVVPVRAHMRATSPSSEFDSSDNDGAAEGRVDDVGGRATGDSRGVSRACDAARRSAQFPVSSLVVNAASAGHPRIEFLSDNFSYAILALKSKKATRHRRAP